MSEWGKNSGSKEEITSATRLDVQRKRFFQLPIDKEQRVSQSSPSKSYPHLELTDVTTEGHSESSLALNIVFLGMLGEDLRAINTAISTRKCFFIYHKRDL